MIAEVRTAGVAVLMKANFHTISSLAADKMFLEKNRLFSPTSSAVVEPLFSWSDCAMQSCLVQIDRITASVLLSKNGFAL